MGDAGAHRRLRERGALLVMAACVPLFHAAVRLLGFRRVHAVLQALGPRRASGGGDDEAMVGRWRERLRGLRRRMPLPLRGNCLSQSLALSWLLAHQGVPTTLHLGAARHGEAFRAHAWVEHAGRPVNAAANIRERYQAFPAAYPFGPARRLAP